MLDTSSYGIAGAALAVALPAAYFLARSPRKRHLASERVLVLGASSGVGHAIARQYARRGARICVVARSAEKLQSLQAECGGGCMAQIADVTVVEDMVRVRQAVEAAWGGLDTVHVCAGVSALQPLMSLTGTGEAGQDASEDGIRSAVDVAGRAMSGNFNGPLVAALTFVRGSARPCSCCGATSRKDMY